MAIRGGGHSVAGHSICSGGLLIDLRLMGGVLIDPESRRARVGGATWRSVDACSAMHRLAMPGGTFDTTGVAGLTLGGGIGHLIGLHGLTLDNLESAEVVLADGTVVTASNTVEPELFWALRGGGGNFGAVTEFEFRLHPLPTVWGGIITYARPQVADAVRLFRDVMATAPDELTMMCYLDHEGVSDGAAYVTVCFAGDARDAQEAIRPLREHLPVLRDGLGLTSYLQIQVMQGDTPFGLRHYWKSHFVESLPDELIDQIVGDVVLFEPMHGAATRVPGGATAFGRREPCFNASALATWENAATDDQHITWARRTAALLERYSMTGGGYVNYGAPDGPVDRVQAAYGDAIFERLRQAKRRYDPDNLFRFNHTYPRPKHRPTARICGLPNTVPTAADDFSGWSKRATRPTGFE